MFAEAIFSEVYEENDSKQNSLILIQSVIKRNVLQYIVCNQSIGGLVSSTMMVQKHHPLSLLLSSCCNHFTSLFYRFDMAPEQIIPCFKAYP
jgi:hypothetical protein